MTDFGSQAFDEYQYRGLQDRTMALLETQESMLESTFNSMALGDTGASSDNSDAGTGPSSR